MSDLFNSDSWKARFSRSGYFVAALFAHLVVFYLVATLVIFPAMREPTAEFTKTYVPSAAPPPPLPPSPRETMPVSTQSIPNPTTTITAPTAAPTFNISVPDLAQATPTNPQQDNMSKPIPKTTDTLSKVRLTSIADTVKNWGRDRGNIVDSNGDPKNVVATFPVYVASYANGDWNCNIVTDKNGRIVAGSLPNLVAKMNEWSRGRIKGEVEPVPLKIAGPELLDKKPPFIFFTGHKNFVLTDTEVKNLQDYLEIGGAIWGDNALAGRGSRFDVAFRREMKRVVPDIDKNFEPVSTTSDIFTKSWFPLTAVPKGMNYYAEPVEHLDLDGKLAILYTVNDYSDMFCMRVSDDDSQAIGLFGDPTGSLLVTNPVFYYNREIYFRNFEVPTCVACEKLGMNIIGYMLVRFDKDLLLMP